MGGEGCLEENCSQNESAGKTSTEKPAFDTAVMSSGMSSGDLPKGFNDLRRALQAPV